MKLLMKKSGKILLILIKENLIIVDVNMCSSKLNA